jgi:site-specific DNA-cytosine methylase
MGALAQQIRATFPGSYDHVDDDTLEAKLKATPVAMIKFQEARRSKELEAQSAEQENDKFGKVMGEVGAVSSWPGVISDMVMTGGKNLELDENAPFLSGGIRLKKDIGTQAQELVQRAGAAAGTGDLSVLAPDSGAIPGQEEHVVKSFEQTNPILAGAEAVAKPIGRTAVQLGTDPLIGIMGAGAKIASRGANAARLAAAPGLAPQTAAHFAQLAQQAKIAGALGTGAAAAFVPGMVTGAYESGTESAEKFGEGDWTGGLESGTQAGLDALFAAGAARHVASGTGATKFAEKAIADPRGSAADVLRRLAEQETGRGATALTTAADRIQNKPVATQGAAEPTLTGMRVETLAPQGTIPGGGDAKPGMIRRAVGSLRGAAGELAGGAIGTTVAGALGLPPFVGRGPGAHIGGKLVGGGGRAPLTMQKGAPTELRGVGEMEIDRALSPLDELARTQQAQVPGASIGTDKAGEFGRPLNEFEMADAVAPLDAALAEQQAAAAAPPARPTEVLKQREASYKDRLAQEKIEHMDRVEAMADKYGKKVSEIESLLKDFTYEQAERTLAAEQQAKVPPPAAEPKRQMAKPTPEEIAAEVAAKDPFNQPGVENIPAGEVGARLPQEPNRFGLTPDEQAQLMSFFDQNGIKDPGAPMPPPPEGGTPPPAPPTAPVPAGPSGGPPPAPAPAGATAMPPRQMAPEGAKPRARKDDAISDAEKLQHPVFEQVMAEYEAGTLKSSNGKIIPAGNDAQARAIARSMAAKAIRMERERAAATEAATAEGGMPAEQAWAQIDAIVERLKGNVGAIRAYATKMGVEPQMIEQLLPEALKRYKAKAQAAAPGTAIEDRFAAERGAAPDLLEQMKQAAAEKVGVAPEPEVNPIEAAKRTAGVETELERAAREAAESVPEVAPEAAPGLVNNASAESGSGASAEALSRTQAMKAKGQKFVVLDRGGNPRPSTEDGAVNLRKGETFGVLNEDGTFEVLNSNGGPQAPKKAQKAPVAKQEPAAATKAETKPPEAAKAPEKAPAAPGGSIGAALESGDRKLASKLAKERADNPKGRGKKGGQEYGVGDFLPDGALVIDVEGDMLVLQRPKGGAAAGSPKGRAYSIATKFADAKESYPPKAPALTEAERMRNEAEGRGGLTPPDKDTVRPFADDYLSVEDVKRHQPISRGEVQYSIGRTGLPEPGSQLTRKEAKVGLEVESKAGLKGTIVKLATSFQNDGHATVKWENGSTSRINVMNLKPSAKAQYSAKPDDLGFYSQAEKVVSDPKAPKKQSGDNWLSYLKNPQRGVTKDELYWTGLGDFLAENKGKPITNEQISAYLKSNKVEIVEHGRAIEMPTIEAAVRPDQSHFVVFPKATSGTPRIPIEINSHKAADGTWSYRHPKSGTEYKFETMEDAIDSARTAVEGLTKAAVKNAKNYGTRHAAYQEPGVGPGAPKNYREIRITVPKTREGTNEFVNRGHYNEPGIVVSFRVNERKSVDGKRILFAEEIQSDAGSKVGKGEKTATAPFEGSTQKYTELAVKRLMRIAAEEGFDRVAWTKGDMQNRRWDIREKADSLKYENGQLVAMKNGYSVVDRPVPREELASYVGKDIANRLLANEGLELSGDNLQVGSSWANDYYDKVIPGTFEKVGKRFGTKLGESEVLFDRGHEAIRSAWGYWVADGMGNPIKWENVHRDLPTPLDRPKGSDSEYSPNKGDRDYFESKADAEAWAKQLDEAFGYTQNNRMVQSVDITPEMRQSIMEEGFPQYQAKAGEKGEWTPPTAAEVKKNLPKGLADNMAKLDDGSYEIETPRGIIRIEPTEKIQVSLEALEKGRKGAAEAYQRGEISIAGEKFTFGGKAIARVVDVGELPHEVGGHVWLDHFASPKQRAFLREKFEAKAKELGQDWREVMADAYKEYHDRKAAEPTWEPTSAVGRFAKSIYDFFHGLYTAFKPSVESTFEGIRTGKEFAKEAQPNVDTGMVPGFKPGRARDVSMEEPSYADKVMRDTRPFKTTSKEPQLVAGGSAGKNVPVAKAGDPSFTLKATPKEPLRIVMPDGSVKKLPIRGAARLMGVEDSYPLPENEALARTILGNGVPPPLMKKVAAPMLEHIENPTGVSLFSGGGIAEQGLKGQVEFIGAVEYNKAIADHYRKANGDHIVNDDVRNVDFSQWEGADYLHASPVCKNFSAAKAQSGEVALDIETAKATARAIEQIGPKVVTVENVPGYMGSEAMKIITDQLDAQGYKWDSKVYDAADYGTPQHRKRMILRATLEDALPEVPKAEAHKSWWDSVKDLKMEDDRSGLAAWQKDRMHKQGNIRLEEEERLFSAGPKGPRTATADAILRLQNTKQARPGEKGLLETQKTDLAPRIAKKAQVDEPIFDAKGKGVVQKNGVVMTKSGAAPTQYSVRTNKETMEAIRRANEKAGGKIFTKEQLDSYEKDINSIAAMVLSSPERLDFTPIKGMSSLKANADARYPKSLDFTTACRRRYALADTVDAIQEKMGRVLEAEDVIKIRQALQDKGVEVNCGPCYVDSRRIHMATAINKAIEGFERGGKTYKLTPKNAKLAMTQEGRDKLFASDPKQYAVLSKAFAGTQIKIPVGRAEYKGEILDLPQSTVDSMNKFSGMRSQSWSDFEVPHLLDKMQAVLDMAARKIKGQSYTKEIEYVETMKDTGEMINMSLIPEGTGLDAAGKPAWKATESIRDMKRAREIRKQYNNVGFEGIGINDAHIKALLADKEVDYVIPYHSSGLKAEFRDIGKMNGWQDYTKEQSWTDAKTGEKVGVDREIFLSEWKGDLKKLDKLAKERGVVPPFQRFRNLPGYEKLLTDRRIWGNDGKYVEQQPVQFKFDMKYVNKLLKEYKGTGGAKGDAEVVAAFTAGEGPTLEKKIGGGISRIDSFDSLEKWYEHHKNLGFSDTELRAAIKEQRGAQPGQLEKLRLVGKVNAATPTGPKEVDAYDSGVPGLVITNRLGGKGITLTHEASGMTFGVNTSKSNDAALKEFAAKVKEIVGDKLPDLSKKGAIDKEMGRKLNEAAKDFEHEYGMRTPGQRPKARVPRPKSISQMLDESRKLSKALTPKTGEESRALAKKDPIGFALESAANYLFDNMHRASGQTEIGQQFGARTNLAEAYEGALLEGPHETGGWAGYRKPAWMTKEDVKKGTPNVTHFGQLAVSRAGTLADTVGRTVKDNMPGTSDVTRKAWRAEVSRILKAMADGDQAVIAKFKPAFKAHLKETLAHEMLHGFEDTRDFNYIMQEKMNQSARQMLNAKTKEGTTLGEELDQYFDSVSMDHMWAKEMQERASAALALHKIPAKSRKKLTVLQEIDKRGLEATAGNTATARKGASAAAKAWEQSGHLPEKGKSVFEWGAGQGADVKFYKDLGLDVKGYDPNWPEFSTKPEGMARVVTSTYVGNVLPPEARRSHWVEAYQRATDKLLVTVRNEVPKGIRKEADGVIVKLKGEENFQRAYTQEELLAELKKIFPAAKIEAGPKLSSGVTAVVHRKKSEAPKGSRSYLHGWGKGSNRRTPY